MSISSYPPDPWTETDLMSRSRFHFTGSLYLGMHGLGFETSICYWQDQPDSYFPRRDLGSAASMFARGGVSYTCHRKLDEHFTPFHPPIALGYLSDLG